jgi:hypothetical protein
MTIATRPATLELQKDEGAGIVRAGYAVGQQKPEAVLEVIRVFF